MVAAPVAVKHSPAGAAPTAIVKASIFSVIEDDEEDEADGGTNWAEKYIQPKSQPQAPPQIERRDPVRPEPAHSGAAALPKGAAVQKQPSLNLHQDNVARFKGTDKTIVEGEDLDVPTWMRLRGKVAK
jgi:cell division protein FtsZ